MEWVSALQSAQGWGVENANSYPKIEKGAYWALLDDWRAALVDQMLTPAPDQGTVAWKRAKLKSEHWQYFDVKLERLEQAIEADARWLAAHPTKKSNAAKRMPHDLEEK
jgi:hypothetical protein